MFLTICQELRELFTEDEVESCFGDDSDDEAMVDAARFDGYPKGQVSLYYLIVGLEHFFIFPYNY
jgi:hypothetical protein